MAQWLNSRPVRSLASFCMIACNSTSVCRLPFISACYIAGAGGHRRLQRRVLGAVCRHDHACRKCRVSRLVGNLVQFFIRPEQYRHDQPGRRGLYRTGERLGAARVHHAGEHRLEIAAALQQAVQPMLRHIALQSRRGRHNLNRGIGHRLPGRTRALAVENDEHPVRPFFAHDDLRGENGIDRQRSLDLHGDQPD